jgi:hypothetical protein
MFTDPLAGKFSLFILANILMVFIWPPDPAPIRLIN